MSCLGFGVLSTHALVVTWERSYLCLSSLVTAEHARSYLCLSSLVTAEHAAVLAERARPNDTSYISIALASLKGY